MKLNTILVLIHAEVDPQIIYCTRCGATARVQPRNLLKHAQISRPTEDKLAQRSGKAVRLRRRACVSGQRSCCRRGSSRLWWQAWIPAVEARMCGPSSEYWGGTLKAREVGSRMFLAAAVLLGWWSFAAFFTYLGGFTGGGSWALEAPEALARRVVGVRQLLSRSLPV